MYMSFFFFKRRTQSEFSPVSLGWRIVKETREKIKSRVFGVAWRWANTIFCNLTGKVSIFS